MISLINRIAWVLSITLWFATMLVFISFTGGNQYGDYWWAIFIFWIILWFVYKSLFLSEAYLSDSIIEYTNKVISRASSWKSINNIWNNQNNYKNTETVIKENKFNKDEDYDEEEIVEINNSNIEKDYNSIWTLSSFEKKIVRESVLQEKVETPKIKIEEKEEVYIKSEPGFFEKFFAENVIAKIWWILLFLWVLFLLWLVYNKVGPVAKLVIWFVIWFVIYWIWVVLDGKWYNSESRILLWVGILINYLVILSGRYLIWWDTSWINYVLAEGTTFIFLILNTIFAVITSLVYKSKTLMLFSFVFAFLNPFLIWAKSDGTPYTLVWYSTIVSLGALFLANVFYSKEEKDFAKYLLNTWFIWWNLLFIIAPITTSSHWVFKLLFVVVIWLTTVYTAYKNNENDLIKNYFIWIYVVFAILLMGWSSAWILNTWMAFIWYMLFLGFALIMSVFIISIWTISLGFTLFLPLLFVIILLVTGNLFMIIPVILGSLFSYLIIFTFLYSAISVAMKYLYFVILWVFLLFSNIALPAVMHTSMDYTTHMSTIIAWLTFLMSAYYFSKKEWMTYLYTIGTIWTISILLPIIKTDWALMITSIWAILIFLLSNILLPFINKNVCTRDLKNLSISLIAWILFAAWELYNYWEIAKYFPGVTLGYAFMGLAILYFFLWYIMFQVIDIKSESSDNSSEDKVNVIYSYLWVSISLFSIAILIIFSKTPAIIASIWLFEATILFFFYNKIKDIKIYIWAIILFIVWLTKFWIFTSWLVQGDYISLLSIFIIFASFVLNLIFLKDSEWELRVPHDIIHIIALLLLAVGVSNIVPHTGLWYSILAISLLIVIIGITYDFLASKLLSYVLFFAICLFYFYHTSSVWWIFDKLEAEWLIQLKSLQYLVVLIPWLWLFFRKFYKTKLEPVSSLLNIAYMVYLFIITSIFVYDIFNNTFALTIYWAVWAYIYLSMWINWDKQKLRTIWLYILTFVVFKIVLYDIWYAIENWIVRVIALMFVGWLMMYISMLYSRKYPGNMMNEFNLSNFGLGWNPVDSDDGISDYNSCKINTDIDKNYKTNEVLSKISVSEYSSVSFLMGEKVIKSKIVNLMKIAKIITQQYKKNEFWAWELNSVYDELYNNYKSQVPASDYKKITTALRDFSEAWWTIVLE